MGLGLRLWLWFWLWLWLWLRLGLEFGLCSRGGRMMRVGIAASAAQALVAGAIAEILAREGCRRGCENLGVYGVNA